MLSRQTNTYFLNSIQIKNENRGVVACFISYVTRVLSQQMKEKQKQKHKQEGNSILSSISYF